MVENVLINYAKTKNIAVGYGRESVAGSLVSYALKITDINPIVYGLLFESFINSQTRKPKIVIDFCHDGKHKIIAEDELKEKFPFAYEYLLKSKSILDKRDNGNPNPVAWYAFGRTQGLDTTFGKKILFSPMNKKPNFIFSEFEEATFYSGYCIKYDGDYNYLLTKLNSKKMEEYIKITARDFRGGCKAYNKKIVQEFLIN